MADKPNVLMIVVDCLRSDRVFGEHRTCRTPQLDALMARSTRVPNMFVENSITAPAFTTIFTGCYSLAHGVTGLLGVKMNDEMFTLADAFMANGYYTIAEATGPLLPMLGIDQGFDEFNYREQQEYFFKPWGGKLVNRLAGGGLPEPWFMMVHLWELHEPRQVPAEFDTEEFGASRYDRALSCLDEYIGRLVAAAGEDTVIVFTGDHGERVDEKSAADTLLPYFLDKLGLSELSGEDDTRVGEDIDLLGKRGAELQTVMQSLMARTAMAESRLPIGTRFKLIGNLLKIGMTRTLMQKRKPGWAGFVEFLSMKWKDFLVGWAVFRGDSHAAQRYMMRDTMRHIINQHGYHIYDYLSRVPFAIRYPEALPADKTAVSEVRNIDIFPTLCDALNLDVPSVPWHGASFVEAMRNGVVESRPLYMETRGGTQAVYAFYIRGVRSAGYKVAYAPNEESAPVELYRLTEDGNEVRNLAEKDPDVVARLREEAETMSQTFAAGGEGKQLSAEEQEKMIAKLKSLGYM
ncbi:MAG: sulfatase-like hydrolase/transferase [Candidatus Lernaella stagnicola]|nr:sulfatase-like hydrolase/transferase [Candidatus Lernaella stagnicola]